MQKDAILQDNTPHRSNVRSLQDEWTDRKAKKMLRGMFKRKSYFRRFVLIFILAASIGMIEHFVSGFTSFSYVYQLTFSFAPVYLAKGIAICFLLVFEFVKFLLYFRFFKAWFEDGLDKGLLLGCLLCTALSMFFSVKGAEPLVYHYSKPPELIQADGMSQFYQSQIGQKKELIATLEADHNKTASWTTINKTIPGLMADIADLEKLVMNKDTSAMSENKAIITSFKMTQVVNKGKVQWIAAIFNLLNFFLISYFIGRFLFYSALDYDVFEASQKHKEGQPVTPLEPHQQQPVNGYTQAQQINGQPYTQNRVVVTGFKPHKETGVPVSYEEKPLQAEPLQPEGKNHLDPGGYQPIAEPGQVVVVQDKRVYEHSKSNGSTVLYTLNDLHNHIKKHETRLAKAKANYEKTKSVKSKNAVINNRRWIQHWREAANMLTQEQGQPA